MSQPQTSPKEQLIRALYMVMYCVIFYLVWLISITIAVLQLLSSLIFKNSNRNLEVFGQSLSIYAQDIVRFVTYNTDKKPFPMDSWPTGK